MGRRTLLLVAALLVAALGTVLVFLYAQNAQNNAQQGQELVKVLVAKTRIELGTTGAAASANGAFDEAQIPRSTVVSGALSDAAPLADLVALVPIYPGQQIIAPQWGPVAQTSNLAIPAGKIALSVQLSDPARVAGFVSPGSKVAIFTSGNVDPNGAVRTVLAGVPVLAVGPTTTVSKAGDASSSGTNANTEAIPTAILTLAVTQTEAEKILYAGGTNVPGSKFQALWFGLMDNNSKVTPGDPGVSIGNLFK